MPEIIDLPNFNDTDLEEIFGGGQGLFGVTYIRTALTPFSIQVFSSIRMMIKKEIEKEEDTIKRPQKKSLSFFLLQ